MLYPVEFDQLRTRFFIGNFLESGMVVLGGPIPKNMVTITGTSGPVTHTTNVAVTVTAPAPGTPDFTLTTSVDSLTITAGNSGTAKITLDPKYGFDNTVDLTITAAPIGPAVTLSRTSISGKGSATVTINVSNDSVSGTYTVTVLGTSGNLAHKAQIRSPLAVQLHRRSLYRPGRTCEGLGQAFVACHEPIHLSFVEPIIGASLAHQDLVRPFLGNPSVFDDDDPVGVYDRRQPVSDDDQGPPLCHPSERILNERLGLGVDIRCRLVKDENARILEESSRNRDSLPLTHGESDPTFANLSIISLLEGDDEFVGVRRL